MERVLIDAVGRDEVAIKRGLEWLIDRGEAGGAAAVWVNSVAAAERLPTPLKGLSARAPGDRFVVIAGVHVRLAHPLATDAARDVPVLAVWSMDDDLERLEAVGPSAVCVIPWAGAADLKWVKSWQPADLRAGTQAGAGPVLRSKVVQAALANLTGRVNLGSGLAHPSDKAAAAQAFKLLRDAREPFDGEEVQVWATANGWSADHARELGELAQKVADGRQVRAPGPVAWREDIVDMWRADAADL